jgi:hypothetical protein
LCHYFFPTNTKWQINSNDAFVYKFLRCSNIFWLNFDFLTRQYWFYFIIALELQHIHKNENISFSGCAMIKSWNFLKKIIFNFKLFHHFEFSKKVLFLTKVNKKRKIDKNHFWKYWVRNKNIFDAILNTAAILNFYYWQQIFYNQIKTFYPSVPLPKYHEFLCKKSAVLNFLAILNFEEKLFLCELWTVCKI